MGKFYYLIPIDEDNIDILSQRQCIVEEGYKNIYTRGAWHTFNELIKKSDEENNLLRYYEIKNSNGKVISWEDFLDILNSKKLKIEKGW